MTEILASQVEYLLATVRAARQQTAAQDSPLADDLRLIGLELRLEGGDRRFDDDWSESFINQALARSQGQVTA
jgi:hypothetical protein